MRGNTRRCKCKSRRWECLPDTKIRETPDFHNIHVHAVPLSREGRRKVRGDRRVPPPALAADYGDLVADCRHSGLEQGTLLLDVADNTSTRRHQQCLCISSLPTHPALLSC